MATRERCRGIYRNGKNCRNRARQEFKGYCGIHKSQAPSNLIPEQRDKRLVDILAAGASLVVLLEKAIEYLPEAVTIMSSFAPIRGIVGMPEEILLNNGTVIEAPRDFTQRIQRTVYLRSEVETYCLRLKGAIAYQDVGSILIQKIALDAVFEETTSRIPDEPLSEYFKLMQELSCALKGYNIPLRGSE